MPSRVNPSAMALRPLPAIYSAKIRRTTSKVATAAFRHAWSGRQHLRPGDQAGLGVTGSGSIHKCGSVTRSTGVRH